MKEEELMKTFPDLTENFSNRELEDLSTISVQEKIHVNDMKEIIDLYKYGVRENPWEKIDFSKIFAKKNLIYNNYFIPAEINTICKVKRSKNMLLNVKKFEKIFQIKLPKLLNEINSEIKNNY